jgi:hypothetical protein
MIKLLWHPLVWLVILLLVGEAALLTYWQKWRQVSSATESKPLLLRTKPPASEMVAEISIGDYKVRNNAMAGLPVSVTTQVAALVDAHDAAKFRTLLTINRARIAEIVEEVLRGASHFELHEPNYLTIKRRMMGGLSKRIGGLGDMIDDLAIMDLLIDNQ